MDELYCVIHKDASYQAEKAAEFLAHERGIDLKAAAEAVKNAPGFLLENAALAKASAFNLRASAYGFETLLLSNKDLRVPPAALTAARLDPGTDGFYYVCGAIKEHVHAEDILALTASARETGAPPGETAPLETGLLESLRARYLPFIPIITGGGQATALPAPPKETVFSADITAGGPTPLRLKLLCDELDYSGLGARKTPSSFDNFRILLDALAVPAFRAVKNRFLEALLNKEPLGPLRHPSADAYDKELTWLLTVTAGSSR